MHPPFLPSAHFRWLLRTSKLCLFVGWACLAHAGEPAPKVMRDCAQCPEVVALPAGTYRMGSPAQEPGHDRDEGLRHGVRIAGFAMGRYEVTVAQYLACVQATACTAPRWQIERTLFSDLGASVEVAQHPIVGVSWQQAQDYVQWLGRLTGKLYKLPSETQWEYAARAGTTSRWSFGDTPASATQYAWFENNSANALHPVGQLRPNAWGLHDMHGNVWEWVQDCYEHWEQYDHFDPRYGKAPHTDAAWEGGRCNNRVARGGSWYDAPARLRSASRYYNSPLHATARVGFRVARAL
jgi:formylglycine-generating enzyme required for sulfatase activity